MYAELMRNHKKKRIKSLFGNNLREYNSEWTGSSENSLVQLKDLERARTLKDPEEAGKTGCNYIISVDVARSERKSSANTAVAVIKKVNRGNGTFLKHLVNLFSYVGRMDFTSQADFIKEKVDRFNPEILVVDGNTIGSALIDELMKESEYPPYSVVNDEMYDKYALPDAIPLIFNLQSNKAGMKASEIHNLFMGTIAKGQLKLLVPPEIVRQKYEKKSGDDSMMFHNLLKPHVETNTFLDEVMNLTYHEGKDGGIIVKRVSKSVEKDKYSAVSYGLFYIGLEEKKYRERKKETFGGQAHILIKKPKFKRF